MDPKDQMIAGLRAQLNATQLQLNLVTRELMEVLAQSRQPVEQEQPE